MLGTIMFGDTMVDDTTVGTTMVRDTMVGDTGAVLVALLTHGNTYGVRLSA